MASLALLIVTPVCEALVIGPCRHKQVSWASTWRLLDNEYAYPVNPEGETDAEKVKVRKSAVPFQNA